MGDLRGRVDIAAGRGSSVDSFPLFGLDVDDYDRLNAEKLDLLLAINADERVTWSGSVRPALDAQLVVPRVEGGLKIWLGTGGNPRSSVRAGQLGLPIAYGILGGTSTHGVRQADRYRGAAERAGHRRETLDVAVASHGLVAPNGADARERFFATSTARSRPTLASTARRGAVATTPRSRPTPVPVG